jgi:predicted ribosomally synthesized peptide with SipW-like signal peptide
MRKPQILRHLKSTRTRAVLSLGVVAALGTTGTFAFWTDSATVSGTSFTAGTLDLQVNNADSVANASGTLSMTNMSPGATSAQILTVKNNGNVPLKWTLAGLLTGGTDDAAFSTNSAISVTVKTGTISGSGNSATCGGTTLAGPTVLTTSSANLIATPQPTTPGSGVGAAATVPLCFQVTFSESAPTSLQNKSAKATFTFTGTSDIS